MQFAMGQTSQSIDVTIVDDAGLPVTGLVAATFPTLTYSRAGANADVSFPGLTDLTTITTAWAAGGVKERSGGRYRLDIPNAICATIGKVTIVGEDTDKRVIVPLIEVVSPVQYSLSPIVGRISSTGEIADSDTIVAYHYAPAPTGPFIVLHEEDDSAYDLTAYSGNLFFVVFSSDEAGNETNIVRLSGGNVAIGGTGNNEVTLSGTTVLTATVGRFRWALRVGVSDNKKLLLQGAFIVKPCANTA